MAVRCTWHGDVLDSLIPRVRYQKDTLGSTTDAERVLTEIRCFMELGHPNIIKLLQVLDVDKHVVLVLEYADGGDLRTYLKALPDRRLPEARARVVFKDILRGVAYAHSHHVTHRDLKLENILMTSYVQRACMYMGLQGTVVL